MLLAIDCGNTHITLGCVDEDKTVSSVFRIPTDRRETEFGYAAKIKQILALQGVALASIKGVAISSVVPPVTDVLVHAAKLLTGCDALVVGAGVKTGLHIRINDPGTVAADLVVAAVATKEEYPLPAVIVDMGTATTVSALDADGRFIGCAILPGVKISLDALAKETALLPSIDIKAPKSPIGANTVDAMKSGVVFGNAGAVDGIVNRFRATLGTVNSVVVTGGVAPLIFPYCQTAMTYDEHLLLKGLGYVWYKNKTNQ